MTLSIVTPENFENLQVTAVLRTAVIAEPYLPLDGVLFYQAVREALGPQDLTTPGVSLPAERFPLPLARAGAGTEWYYRCSWAQWSAHTAGQDHWNKRFDAGFADLIDFGKRKATVIIEQGRYKAYHQMLFYRAALWVRWYGVGDRAEIARLLSTCTHLGKKTAQGWGRVARWEVAPCAEDWSVWRDGALMRGIPATEQRGPADFAFYGVRPSYWDRANQTMLAMPNLEGL